MALAAPAITSAILAANPSLVGPSWIQTATAVGIAVQTWAVIPANVVLIGSVSGAIGGGVVNGKFTMNPAPLPVSAACAAAGLVGPQSAQVALAVGSGVGVSFNAAGQYVGTATGAIGADISKVTFANPATLIALLTANLAAQGIAGPVAAQLAVGLGNGIAAMVLTGGGVGVVAGVPGPSPGTGITRSSLL
jgi:hypothetical protein